MSRELNAVHEARTALNLLPVRELELIQLGSWPMAAKNVQLESQLARARAAAAARDAMTRRAVIAPAPAAAGAPANANAEIVVQEDHGSRVAIFTPFCWA